MTTLPHLPSAHTKFLQRALPLLRADARIVGVAVAGSCATGRPDAYSDLDLVIAVEADAAVPIMAARSRIAAQLGPLVAAFTGEHVGEPRLLICLYAPDGDAAPLHVDLKFVALADAAVRVDEPVVLWERDGRLSAVLHAGPALFPAPDLGWIEARFWVWVHYATTKIGRGEWFEAVDFLAFLRAQVLGPLILLEAGATPAGVRRIEMVAPERVAALQATLAGHDPDATIRSLYAAVALYRDLRRSLANGRMFVAEAAERVAMDYLARIAMDRSSV